MSRNFSIMTQVTVSPTPEQLADCFWHMNAEEQCAFFKHLHDVAQERLCFQLQYVIDSPHMSSSARRAMQVIGEYGEHAPSKPHILYTDDDLPNDNIPPQLLDGNGQVALGMCKVCGRVESELDEPCTERS